MIERTVLQHQNNEMIDSLHFGVLQTEDGGSKLVGSTKKLAINLGAESRQSCLRLGSILELVRHPATTSAIRSDQGFSDLSHAATRMA